MAENAKVVSISRESDDDQKDTTSQKNNTAFEPPKKPSFLDDKESLHWDELVESLGHQHRIINNLDGDMLSIYVRTYARWLSAESELDTHGMFQESPNGYQQYTPHFTASRDLAKQALTFARQLGLTPPARLQMKSGAPESQDAFDF